MSKVLNIENYTYDLPQHRIALHPLKERDQSRLLIYKRGEIRHQHFTDLPNAIREGSLLVFNNTKVIQARIHFKKETGADIEVFLLHPFLPSPLLIEAMQAEKQCTWQCTIGNLKRWKEGTTLTKAISRGEVTGTLKDREQGLVEFEWTTGEPFASVIAECGQTPLPPYLRREPEEEDRVRYQTIYSMHEGAVAAPTAGLHFTPRIFESLAKKNIKTDFLTLHVSAGTFQPIKEQDASRHVMHQEQMVVSRKNLEALIEYEGKVIPVGTTSMRTLESLYWFGVKLLTRNITQFTISQEDAYTLPQNIPLKESLMALRELFNRNNVESISGETSIFIRPGYTFRVCNGLITNFHQPQSTLILLVAAFIGDDWKKVYQEAIEYDYRFLSYGDSSLLIP